MKVATVVPVGYLDFIKDDEYHMCLGARDVQEQELR